MVLSFSCVFALLATLSWSATTSAQDYGRCHVYWPDQPATACGYVPTQADTDGSCGTADHPCISTMDQVTWGSADCDKCYKLTYTVAEKTDVTCVDNTCPGYTSSVYIRVVDGSGSDAKHEMAQDAFAKLCPFACLGGESCVQEASTCMFGAIPVQDGTQVSYPGSCAVSKIPVMSEEVACGATAAPAPPTAAPAPPTAAPAPPTAAPAPPTAAPAPPTAAPAPPSAGPAPSGDLQCYHNKEHVWWTNDCADVDACILGSADITTEAACAASGYPYSLWTNSVDRCRAELLSTGGCVVPAPLTDTHPTAPADAQACFHNSASVWWELDCTAADLCVYDDRYLNTAACEASTYPYPYFGTLTECRAFVKSKGGCNA